MGLRGQFRAGGKLTAMAQNPTPAPSSTPTAEPGYTTTEFWVTILTMLIGLLTTLGVIHVNVGTAAVNVAVQELAGLLAMFVPAGLYALGRSIRKSGTQG